METALLVLEVVGIILSTILTFRGYTQAYSVAQPERRKIIRTQRIVLVLMAFLLILLLGMFEYLVRTNAIFGIDALFIRALLPILLILWFFMGREDNRKMFMLGISGL